MLGEKRIDRRLVKAVDTNVVVRAIVRDDVRQSDIANGVLRSGAYIGLTVLLETGWLLRSRYGFDRAMVADALSGLIDLPAVQLAQPELTAWAIERLRAAGDFADLVHLVAAQGSDAFVTFDRALAAAAGAAPPLPVETLDV